MSKEIQAAIALTRFGMGARPGEIKFVQSDPKAWLLEQIRTPSSALIKGANLPNSYTLTKGTILDVERVKALRKSKKTPEQVSKIRADIIAGTNLRSIVRKTSDTSAMILFVVIGATCFSVVFKRLGGDYMIEQMITGTGLGPYGLLMLVMALIFVLGFFIEWIEISFVVLPLVAPVIAVLDFGAGLSGQGVMVWFAILVAINLQTSFLTPPFGYALFYLKGITGGQISIGTIYRSIIPFVLLQMTGLALCIFFPQIVLWLPGLAP